MLAHTCERHLRNTCEWHLWMTAFKSNESAFKGVQSRISTKKFDREKMSIRLALRATQEEAGWFTLQVNCLQCWNDTCVSVPTVILRSPEDHVLVYWPEEDCTTVLYISNMMDPSPPVVGKPCTVRIGSGKSYRGVTARIGMLRLNYCTYVHART